MTATYRAPAPVRLARPPKPVSEMTEAELDAWASEVHQEFTRQGR
jgi:hypothetical protein